MKPDDIINIITKNFKGVIPKNSWGETSLFYNPGKKLPNGVYFCTIKEQDGENDKSSNLSRKDVFRVSIGLPVNIYQNMFGDKPKRPPKGGVVDTKHDFTKINTIMPHPIYAWMSWICVLSPSKNFFKEIYPLIEEAHIKAAIKFNEKMN